MPEKSLEATKPAWKPGCETSSTGHLQGHWTDTTQDGTSETLGALKDFRSYTTLHVRNINKPWVDKI